MGTLINVYEFNIIDDTRAAWYFDDAYYSSANRNYVFVWPSKQYPHMVSIHEDILLENGNRAKLRRWVEQHVSETVMHDIVDNSYRIYHTKDREYNRSHSVYNKWCRFWFEHEESALAFKLRFSDIASPITKTHPTRHYEPEF